MKKIIILMFLILTLTSCFNKEEKQRDAGRISDLQLIKTGLVQFYDDNSEFPKKLEGLKEYISIPKDSKDGETINGCTFGYTYEVFADEYKIERSAYRLSTCLEVPGEKTKNDGGIYDNKFEIYSK